MKSSNQVDHRLLTQLLAIPGKSCEEGAVADFVTQELKKAGARDDWIQRDAAHKSTPTKGQVGNLILKLPGTMRGPRRLLMAHLDTVPICVGCKPVLCGDFIRSADKRTGLGADNRAGCAVILSAAKMLLRRDLPHPPLTFLWTVQEEIGLQGAKRVSLSRMGRPAIGFNWDGGNASKLTIGATGGYRMSIRIDGKASHAGGAPERGVSAIAIASLAIAELHEGGWHGQIHHAGKAGTSNVGVISGGNATNVVADHVTVAAEARSHDPVFRKKIVAQIERSFRRAAKRVRSEQGDTGGVQFDGRLDYEAFCLPTGHHVVKTAEDAVEKIGRKPELAVANGGLDANWLTARGVPTVSLGCGQTDQHTVSEALDVRQFGDACRIAAILAQGGHE